MMLPIMAPTQHSTQGSQGIGSTSRGSPGPLSQHIGTVFCQGTRGIPRGPVPVGRRVSVSPAPHTESLTQAYPDGMA